MISTNIIYATKDITTQNITNQYINLSPRFMSETNGKDHCLFLANDYNPLLYFDLSSLPPKALITSATLCLYLFKIDPLVKCTIDIKQFTNDFYEYPIDISQKTAGDSPHYESSNLRIIPIVSGDTNTKEITPSDVSKIISFTNLTRTIKSWYAEESLNHGFQLSCDFDGLIGFWSKEYKEKALGPHLKVEYTIEPDVPSIETIITSEEVIIKEDKNSLPSFFNISNALFFNYVIKNNEPYPVSIKMLTSPSRTNFSLIYTVKETLVPQASTRTINVSSPYKYVFLAFGSLNPNPRATINVTSVYKTFSNMTPPTVRSLNVLETGSTIVLIMSKPLIGSTVNIDSFLLSLNFNTPNARLINFSFASLSSTTLTLHLPNAIITKNDTAALCYMATGSNDLTGLNGDVDNFNNMPLINNSLFDPSIFNSGKVSTDGNKIVLEMTKELTGEYKNYTSFIIKNSLDVNFPVTAAVVNGKLITLTIDKIIKKDFEIKISYIDVTSDKLTGLDGDVPMFMDQLITNSSTIETSILKSGEISQDGTTIILAMTKPLTNTTADISAFTIENVTSTACSSSPMHRYLIPQVTIKSITIKDANITLTLNKPLNKYAKIILSYLDSTDNKLIDDIGSVDNFTTKGIVNKSNIESSKIISAKIPIDGSSLALTMTKPLDKDSSMNYIPCFSIFNATLNRTLDIFSVDISSNIVTLTPVPDKFKELDKLEVSYNPFIYHLTDSKSPIYFLTGVDGDVDSFSNFRITNNSIFNPATVNSGIIDDTGKVIVLTMSKNLTGSTCDINNFSFSENITTTISSIIVSDSTVTLSLNKPISKDDDVILNYNPSNDPMLSGINGDVVNFKKKLINNSSFELSKLKVSEVSKYGKLIILTMSKPLIGITADPTAFSISDSHVIVTKVDISDLTVTLTVDSAILQSEKPKLSYDSSVGTSPLKGIDGEVASFANITLDNKSIFDPAIVTSASIPEIGKSIILKMSQKLTGKYSTPSQFTISDPAITVTKVGISSSTVTLTLNKAILESTTLTLSYEPDLIAPLKGMNGSVAPFVNTPLDNKSIFNPSTVTNGVINVDGLSILLTMSKELTVDYTAFNQFTISVPESKVTMVTILPLSVKLSVDKAIIKDIVVLLSYTPIPDSIPLSGPNGDVALFTDFELTNNSNVTA